MVHNTVVRGAMAAALSAGAAPVVKQPQYPTVKLSVGQLLQPLASASPRLRFGTGESVNDTAVISPTLPNMPSFPASSYYIQQWAQTSYISPTIMQQNNLAAYDPLLGAAAYSFESPDGHSRVSVYPNNGSWAYELYESGGKLTSGGGSNIFLSTDQFAANATLDRTITFDFDAKVSRAAISASAEAQASGIVLADVFAGFGLMFVDPANARAEQFVFMQVSITASRAQDLRKTAAFYCSGGKVTLFSPNLNNGEPTFSFVPDIGPLHHFHYPINNYLDDLILSTECGPWPAAAASPENWRLTGFYMGLEAESQDARGATPAAPLGTVEVGLQVANIVATMQ